jgi:hypothetical protein
VPSLPPGRAAQHRNSPGAFDFVISTRIDEATAERPHFFITYGTKSIEGLRTFRETEYAALRAHARNRASAKEKKREDKTKCWRHVFWKNKRSWHPRTSWAI